MFIIIPILAIVFSLFAYAYSKKRFLETPIATEIDQWQFYGAQYLRLKIKSLEGNLPKWQSGAHIIIELDAEYGKIRRPFSICGGDQTYYELLIHADGEGKVSGHILKHLTKGAILNILPPRGRFFNLERTSKNQLLFLASGVGLAPLLPMLKEKLEQGVHVNLIHSVPFQNNLVDYDVLTALEVENHHFKYFPIITQEKSNTQKIIQRRIDKNLLLELGFDQFDGDVFLCGSHAFVQDLILNLQALKLGGQVFEESFTGYTPNPNFKITVDGRTFAQGKNQTILAACEEQNILPFAECRTGHCLNCRAVLCSGKVKSEIPINQNMKNNGLMKDNMILTCCSVPETDIEIKFL